ncbi:MAG: hypothetical protein R2750_03665 [Bacteroidales bacterium]
MKKTFLNLGIDKQKARDTGLALVLILLIIDLLFDNILLTKIAVVVLVVDMIVPIVFKPLAYLWFGLAHMMGTIISKVMLFVVYFVFVVPVGFFRKMTGKDPMQLKKWKKNNDSVFVERNLKYSANDIDKPY